MHIKWETERRYYVVRLDKDLLGDWTVQCAWGGRFNKLGGEKTVHVTDEADGVAYITKLGKTRTRRKYLIVSRAN